MANSLENKLVVSDLDFDTIKTNLKNFLQSQSTFTDYDFEGSGMSSLLDVLAYNTHYMAFYINMLANESFLDTASIRSAVVSHAKMLGYTPHSVTSAVATINLSFTISSSSEQSSLTLPRFTKFASSGLNGVNYTFCNLEEHTVSRVGDTFTFQNIRVTEGKPVTYIYSLNTQTNPSQEFILPDIGIDTETIEVIVQNSAVDLTQSKFYKSTDATVVEADSNVFYLDEIDNKKYKIYFGDDIIGKKLVDGNMVVISYLVSAGPDANKSTNLTILDSVDGLSGTVTMVQAASGGVDIEPVADIKFAATKNYASNNRAVTKNDYISLIQKKYPSLDAVNVWGGEENDPPIYGKVFVSAKPTSGYELTMTEKQNIIDEVIAPMSVVTVTPDFVDPDYNFLNLGIKVTYDPTLTSKTYGQIETAVRNAVYNFSNTNLNQFNSYFKVSRMMRDIDNIDSSILSNQIDVIIEKHLEPVLGTVKNYTVKFYTPLERSTGKNRIVSTPAFTAYDADDNLRQLFFEEVPLSYTGISSVKVLVGGSGFVEAPTLVVLGDGVGAKVTPVVTNGKITSVTVDSAGSEYTTASIKAYDSRGNEISSIVLEAVIENRIGILRTYYYDSNEVKTIFSDNAGTIDYKNGVITINSFAPVDILNDTKVLEFYAKPENALFASSKNCILTIDHEEGTALQITVVPVTS